jgi:16S rRNA U1498 N3-methylase RsmE
MFTLFFVDDLPTTIGSHYEFANEDANHAIRVLRMQPGAEFMLGDGNGAWSQVKALEVSKKTMQVKLQPLVTKKRYLRQLQLYRHFQKVTDRKRRSSC